MSNEPIFPRPDVLNEMEYGKFVLTNLAARRAKMIRDGAPPLVRIESNHPLSIALAEIAAGKIKPIFGGPEAMGGEIDEFAALDTVIEGEGLLLPSIEEDEALAVGLGLGELTVDDFEHEDDHDEALDADEVGSIADLLGDEDMTDASEASEDGDISLDDLKDQEIEEAGEDEEDADPA